MVLGLRPSDRPAVVEASTGRAMSFAELIADGAALMALLDRAKQAVLVFARNDRFTAVAYAGALLAGRSVMLANGDGPVGVQAPIVDAYRIPWLIGPAGLGDAVKDAGVPVTSALAVDGGEIVRTGHLPPIVHRDLAVMLATSATTGSRKFVRLSGANIESNAKAIGAYLRLDAAERPLISLPLHYSFGLSVLNSHWAAGAAVVLTTESVVRPEFWDAARALRCTSLAGVPYTYQMLERIGFRQMDLPSIHTLQQAGGDLGRPLAETYGRHMASRGGRFFVMYGQTEATARMAYVPPDRLTDKLGSAGIAIPGGHLRIEPQGDPDRDRAIGEVVYSGPNVMMGYADGHADLARGDDLQGVLHTGDLGYLDGDGFLYLVGRSKRIAKVYGLRVNLDEVEMLIRASGPVAVVAGSDQIWAFCAFGTDASLAELAESLGRRLQVHRRSLHLRRVGSIPTTTVGKTDYQEVQRWIRLAD